MNKFLVFLIMICSAFLNAQGYESTILGSNITAPTASGIASKIKSPSAMSTGIPEIEIPFFSLAAHQKGVAINLGLTYHPNNTFMESKASDVGLGWNLTGSTNLIYREVDQGNGVPNNNYHFNFLGRGGTFQFFKEGNALIINKVTENRFQISVTETGTDLYKFKIIDENGISYYFETLDNSYYYNALNAMHKAFTSCFYLTRIDDLNANELAVFEYQEDSYQVPANAGNTSQISVKSLKINKITSRDFGSIQFSYSFDSNFRKSYVDPFQLNFVELKNKAGKLIEKYALQSQYLATGYPYGFIDSGVNFGCSYYLNQQKRQLTKVLKYGTGNSYETTEIKYPATYPGNNFVVSENWSTYPNLDAFTCFTAEYNNPKYLGAGLLQSIKYPNGTEVRYTFEPNIYYVDKSFPNYQHLAPPHEVKDRDAQYFEYIGSYPFDFQYGPYNGGFTLPVNPDEPDGHSYLFFHIRIDELYTNGPIQPTDGNFFVTGELLGGVNGYDVSKKYPPGKRSFSLTGTGGKGIVTIHRIRYKSVPLPNYSTGKGVRIKKIEYLDNNVVNEGLTKSYNYQKFDGSSPTSGFFNEIENEESVVYQNVKETIGQNNGYTKYYYKTLYDLLEPTPPQDTILVGGNTIRFVNILKDGLLAKREVFAADNSLIQKDSIHSEMLSIRSAYVGTGSYNGQSFDFRRNGVIKYQKTISTAYTASGAYSNISEITRDKNDFNVINEKNTGSDGTVSEVNIIYPWGQFQTDPKLWNANITSIPLIVESKRNGSIISKSETKFENTSHFYPTSQLSFLPDNLSQSLKNASFDIYDDKGNLVQYTSFPEVGSTGISTTIIYGYDKTLPIAKIEGAKLSDIPASFITAIVNASNEDGMATVAQEEAKEQALINALNTFKNDVSLQNFMITCYTYNPLIGITTTIPPNGMMELYKYDSFNRLLKTVDVNGNTIKEHKYNYKH
ncbi:hypothetical protein LNP04_07275 [Chryseobacterium sp. C-71]|uniref:hypothetical protein n=1 Tax=Chryseobacterium sp. C-71 TaxID=2893882 RepID=UPI001E549542|nr:hypothetical protein [Chryseobacterium sp. C-71]UFH33502.1 hypothetical protein LNP04_07275 [Chryseobacterium sp. C-71]